MHPFRAAVEARDYEAIANLLADDVVFYSPIAHKPYQGKFVVGMILGTVIQIFENFHYQREIGAEGAADHALVFGCQIDGLDMQGCDFLTMNDEGKITEFTVMLRPLRVVGMFAEKMKVKFAEAMAAAKTPDASLAGEAAK